MSKLKHWMLPWEAKMAREHHSSRGNASEYGKSEVRAATGRATCRCCGLRVAKGEPALHFAWDFHGSGSWTLSPACLHWWACEEVEREEDYER